MDIRLIRRPHTNQMVRVCGIEPTDPYLEWCWLPVVGPSTVALVRHVADLTSSTGEAHVPLNDLGRQLGLGAVDVPSRNNKLVRTLGRAEQFGLAFTSMGVPGGSMTFGIHNELALVPTRLLQRLPELARQRHVAAVEAANEALTAAGLPALRSPLPIAGGPLNAPGPSPRPWRPNHRAEWGSGRCTRRLRSPVSTRPPRPRPRPPSSRCDPDATAHVSRGEHPTRPRRTRSRPLARSLDSTPSARSR